MESRTQTRGYISDAVSGKTKETEVSGAPWIEWKLAVAQPLVLEACRFVSSKKKKKKF